MSAEDFAGLKELRKERHAEWRWQNLAALEEAGLTDYRTVNDGACLMFRELRKPKVDFYPHTGRWKDCRDGRIYKGGAKLFIVWYEKESAIPDQPRG